MPLIDTNLQWYKIAGIPTIYGLEQTFADICRLWHMAAKVYQDVLRI
jgi:hypothetical protein